MVFLFEQNDFFAKRFVHAKKTPNGNGSEAVSEPAAEKKKPTDTPGSSVVDESRQKISDLLDDRTKVDKLIGVQEGQVLSPKEMLANMKKVVREDQASDDWVRQTYDKFYAAELVGGVTKDVRRDMPKRSLSDSRSIWMKIRKSVSKHWWVRAISRFMQMPCMLSPMDPTQRMEGQ